MILLFKAENAMKNGKSEFPQKDSEKYWSCFTIRKIIFLFFAFLTVFTLSAADSKVTETKTLGMDIYPIRLQDNVYNLCESFPGGLLIRFFGDLKKLNKKPVSIVLDLPENIEYVGSSGYMPSKIENNIPEFAMDQFTAEQFMREGKKYNRYIININPSVYRSMTATPTWWNSDRLYLKTKKETSAHGGIAFWELKAGEESCARDSFLINVLPPLKSPAKKCSRFGLLVSRLASLTVPSGEISNAHTDYWFGLHEKPLTLAALNKKYSPEYFKKISGKFEFIIMEANEFGTPYFINTFNKKEDLENKLPPSVDYQNKPLKASIIQVSPWYLIKDPEGIVWNKSFSKFADSVKNSPVKIKSIVWDIEPGAKDHCFSQENREEFQKFTGLEAIPTIEEIRKNYTEKWFAFRVEQHRLIIQQFSKAMRKYLPDTKFILCTDPLQEGKTQVSDWCGVDARLSDNDVDMHMNMPYYSGLQYYNNLELNMKYLKKPNFPLIDPAENAESFYFRYTPEKVKQNIIASAALGAAGIGFWPEDLFDGRYLVKISEAFDIVSCAESFYSSPRCAIKAFEWEPVNVIKKTFKSDNNSDFELQFPNLQEKVKVISHKNSEGYLITILNYEGTNTAILKLSLDETAAQWYQVTEVGSGNKIYTKNGSNFSGNDLKQGILVSVSPDEVKAIKIASSLTQKHSVSPDKTLPQEKLQEKLQTELSQIKVQDDVYKIKKDGTSIISWSSINENKTRTPYMKMIGKERFLRIDTRKGSDIIGWENNKIERDDILVIRWSDRGFLGRLVLNDKSQLPSPYDFKIEKTSVSNTGTEVIFKYKVPSFQGANPLPNPLDGLEITKTVTLSPDGRECNIKFEFLNNNPMKNKMTFGFRINNYPRIGSFIAGNKTVSEIGEIVFTDTEGKTGKIYSDSPLNNLILKKNANTSFETKATVENWNGEEVKAIAHNANSSSVVRFIPDPKMAGLYVWRSKKDYTLEFLSQDLELPFGKTEEFSTKIIIEKPF